jgi:hypothetical protein
VEVLAHDPERAWLLTADAGAPLDDLGNPPERWLELLPRYAELQRDTQQQRGQDDLAGLLELGVPELRWQRLPQHFDELLSRDLPLEPAEVAAAGRLGPRLEALVEQFAALPIPDAIDHADLHHRSVFSRDGRLRILDWGDASISHPFFSLEVTFHWLREINGLAADDPWFDRLRDAYLEPWGPGLAPVFETAQRLGKLARALAWQRHREAMAIGAFPLFDELHPVVLREAFAGLARS